MALDQITRSLLEDFLNESDTPPMKQPQAFERFAANVVISPHIDGAIDYENIITGDGGDTGIDAIAIIVNGELLTDPDEVDVMASSGTTINAHYIFVQSETAAHFSTGKIGQILAGVKDFFAEKPSLVRNEVVEALAEISKKILSNARLFRDGNPSCAVYYVTAGRWTDDQNLSARMTSAENDIEDLVLFSSTRFVPLGAREIQKRYRDLKHGYEREFTFQEKVPLPVIDHVKEAHLGFIPAAELLSILVDEDGKLAPTAFYENVRDFQGEDNPVNSEIGDTLAGDRRSLFPLMNNGITIISKSMRQTGTKFFLRDFQVVNGCQTCNIIWSNRDKLDSTVLVPLRLISTEDEDVIVDIIRATNRQTEVKEEQFYASSDYLKQMEMYFESIPSDRRLHLERRSKQYVYTPVERTRIVQFRQLVRSFASLVLNEPHRATRDYKQLLERIHGGVMLHREHRAEVYYAAASSLYRVEFLLRNGVLERKFSPAKWHLILASRFLIDASMPKHLNGQEAARWAERLLDVYWDGARSEEMFLRAASDIEDLASGDLSRDRIRTSNFTEQLISRYRRDRR